MKLFLLEVIDDDKGFGLDCNYGFVIRAKDEETARKYAANHAADEGPKVWLNTVFTTCIEIQDEGEGGIILMDFRAG